MQLPDPFQCLILSLGALVASTVAAVSGFGGAAILLPILTAVFGVRDAIPILTVAQLLGNAARVWLNRRDLDGRVVGWFALGAVPMAAIGSILFATAPLALLTRALGVFLILVVVWRRLRPSTACRPRLSSFALIGGGFSFLSALLGSVGPLMAPFFLAYGLVKGAYIGTEALATVIMHVTKLAVYQRMDVLSGPSLLVGLALGPLMFLGSWLGKAIVDNLSPAAFQVLVELGIVAAGLIFLIRG